MAAVLTMLREKLHSNSAVRLTPMQMDCLAELERARNDTGIWAITVSGYAGTGKTTTIAAYVQQLVDEGLRVAVSAPTNKATRVLRSKIAAQDAVHFGSIHSLLGLQMTEFEDGTQKCERKRDPSLGEFDIIIIDECSMIGKEMYQQIDCLREKGFIVFVGDPYQLPPVEESGGGISPTFARASGKAEFVLSEIIRQAAGNPIIDLSMAIREAEKNGERFGADRMAAQISQACDERLFLIDPEHVLDLAEQKLRESKALGEALGARVVAWRNQRVETINREIHERLYGKTECPFSVGEQVMAHTEFQALSMVRAMKFNPKTGMPELRSSTIPGAKIFTSEEVVVTGVEHVPHEDHQDIDSWKIGFRREDGKEDYCAWTPSNGREFEQMLQTRWREWREIKARHQDLVAEHLRLQRAGASETEIRNRHYEAQAMDGRHRAHSSRTWKIRRDHAQIRHAYASTAHKAQGSTWKTAIIDLADLSRMPSDSDYNRALYVAVTRASESLAVAI